MEEYKPFQFNNSGDPKENALSFLDWIVHSITVLHQKQDITQQYVKSLHEDVQRAKAQSNMSPTQPVRDSRKPSTKVGFGEVARAGQWIMQNRDAVLNMFRLFRGMPPK